ncbi:MAG: septation protein IspZ, partial [Gammaproteobacteria bacterium]|nr:septation protein IspZ [Gammaproteobacteria bacterium]
KHRKVESMHVVTLVLITVFGGATIYLQDPVFIKWKVTLVNWIFALAFLGSQFIGERNLTQRMMGGAIKLKKDIWTQLNLSWVLFFFALGFINLYVMYNFDEATWVNFKLFGLMGLTFAFVILQAIFMSPYIEIEEKEKD